MFEVGKFYRDSDGAEYRCMKVDDDDRQPILMKDIVTRDLYNYSTDGQYYRDKASVRDIVMEPILPEDLWNYNADGQYFSNMTSVHDIVMEPTLPDSGDRTQFDTGAVRDAMSGKGLPSLIPPEAIRRCARRFEDGANKYGLHNWMKGIPLSRYQDAITRHTLAAAEGQTDEDHLGAVLWNAAAWVWTQDEIEAGRLPESLDDRPYRKGASGVTE